MDDRIDQIHKIVLFDKKTRNNLNIAFLTSDIKGLKTELNILVNELERINE